MKNNSIKKIKNKIINTLMINGKKNTSEKNLLKSFKSLNKNSKKQTSKIFKLSIINLLPIFKLQVSENKKIRKKKRKSKIMPIFVLTSQNRISSGIKLILNNLKKKSNKSYNFKFSKEILLSAQNKSSTTNLVKEIHKKAIQNKKYFKRYRW